MTPENLNTWCLCAIIIPLNNSCLYKGKGWVLILDNSPVHKGLKIRENIL